MSPIQPTDEIIYRERLTPPLWLFVIILLGAPMIALALKPLGDTLSLLIAAIIAITLILTLSINAPEIKITTQTFSAGRAKIDRSFITQASTLDGASEIEKRQLHGKANTWLLLRAGIKSGARLTIEDPDDPNTHWVVSSRTPERIIVALEISN